MNTAHDISQCGFSNSNHSNSKHVGKWSLSQNGQGRTVTEFISSGIFLGDLQTESKQMNAKVIFVDLIIVNRQGF